MNFSDIIGQKEVVAGLKEALAHNRVGHAYGFAGPKGIGKKTVARIFAGALLCDGNQFDGGCGECAPCRMYQNGSNPDFFVISRPDSSIGVEDIRDLQSDIHIRPLYSKRKVYLITDADSMTVQAQNCLLKTLEEPPSYAVIILTVSGYTALLETVRSRILKIPFKKNTFEEVMGFLKERFGDLGDRAGFIAAYADGLIGTALELAASDEFMQMRNRAFDLAMTMDKVKSAELFDRVEFFEGYRENVGAVLNILSLAYRDLLMYKYSGRENVLINSDKKDIIVGNAPRFSPKKLADNIERIEQTRRSLEQNANFQLAIEVLLMKLREDTV